MTADINVAGKPMNRFLTTYLTRSGLTAAAVSVFIGVIDLFKAFRNRNWNGAIGVVIIFFIVMPAFALWARRSKPTQEAQQK